SAALRSPSTSMMSSDGAPRANEIGAGSVAMTPSLPAATGRGCEASHAVDGSGPGWSDGARPGWPDGARPGWPDGARPGWRQFVAHGAGSVFGGLLLAPLPHQPQHARHDEPEHGRGDHDQHEIGEYPAPTVQHRIDRRAEGETQT